MYRQNNGEACDSVHVVKQNAERKHAPVSPMKCWATVEATEKAPAPVEQRHGWWQRVAVSDRAGKQSKRAKEDPAGRAVPVAAQGAAGWGAVCAHRVQ